MSPFLSPKAKNAKWSAEVPLLQTVKYLEPSNFFNSFSNFILDFLQLNIYPTKIVQDITCLSYLQNDIHKGLFP